MDGATRPAGNSGPASFEDTVKDFWASRPQRPRRGRKIAGVAAGVGNRYGIDPVIVRVALVVATIFGGIGIGVYLLGWLFFPGEDDDVSAFEGLLGRGRSSANRVFTICLCVALIPTLSWGFGNGWFGGSGLVGLLALASGLYVLHRNRGQYNRPVAAAGQPTGFTTAEFSAANPATAATSASAAGTAQQRPAETPPGWDPLGAAPFAWDLPDPAPQPPAEPPRRPRMQGTSPRRTRSKAAGATFGIALVVGGVGAALASSGTAWFSPQHVIGLVLGVLGIGLVAASFAGGGRGLVWLAIPLSIAGIALSTVAMSGMDGGVGNIDDTPRTIADLRPSYERGMGSIMLDLTELEASAPITVPVEVGMGSAEVIVPETADVTYTCSSGMGDVNCLGAQRSGMGDQEIASTSLGSDGVGGQKITVDVSSGMGSVEVRRG